jgi:hypothetical protein
MNEPTAKLFDEEILRGLERVDAGDETLITYRGVAVLAFRRDVPIERNIAIATLLRLELSGKSTAMLTDVSEAHVTGVRQRVKEGGLEALVARGGKGGTPRRIVGALLRRVIRLRERGSSISEISKAIGVPNATVGREIKRLSRRTESTQSSIPGVGAAAQEPIEVSKMEAHGDPEVSARPVGEELEPGVSLPPSEIEHPCRYAGVLLLCAATDVIGVRAALDVANVCRPPRSVYDAQQVLVSMMAAWACGHGSLESMHERDARALGVVLGLERSPSVRTLHRAIAQMCPVLDPITLGKELMCGLMKAGAQTPLIFGVDGHVKPYAGKSPIDKGWDSKRRMAVKGVACVLTTDLAGMTWLSTDVPAGDSLSQHLLDHARQLRGVHGTARPIVLAFDRGGFDLDVLGELAREGFHYIGYLPSTVTAPDLATIALPSDGVNEVAWSHPRVAHHARLLVERDADALVPAVTNLPTLIDAPTAMQLLRDARGTEENAIKAARAFAHIDRLVDRGGHRVAPDDRPIDNPERARLRAERRRVARRVADLDTERPVRGKRKPSDIDGDRVLAALEEDLVEHELRAEPAKVPRMSIDPKAQRAWLKSRNRTLLAPLKLGTDNARRWLLATLHSALAPSDADHDASAINRTLLALLHAPGTVRFEEHRVHVTLDLQLPPTAHRRLADALVDLDRLQLRFTDRTRCVVFRLAPRPTRANVAA